MNSGQGDHSEDPEEFEPPIPDYLPSECIFCSRNSGILGPDLEHMTVAHGFTVPFQDNLDVDIQTFSSLIFSLSSTSVGNASTVTHNIAPSWEFNNT